MPENPLNALVGGRKASSDAGYFSKNTAELDDLLFAKYKDMLNKGPAKPQVYTGTADAKNVLGWSPSQIKAPTVNDPYSGMTPERMTYATPNLSPMQVNPSLFSSAADLATKRIAGAGSQQTQQLLDDARYKGMGRTGVTSAVAQQGQRNTQSQIADTLRDLSGKKMEMEFREGSDINKLKADLDLKRQGMQGEEIGGVNSWLANLVANRGQFELGRGELGAKVAGMQADENARGMPFALQYLEGQRGELTDDELKRLQLMNQFYAAGMKKPTSSSSSTNGIIPAIGSFFS